MKRDISLIENKPDFWKKYKNVDDDISRFGIISSYIKTHLECGRMSALVGSGFSKNANPEFPSWANLLVDAYGEMHLEAGGESEKKIRSIGESKVAGDYVSYNGGKREVLDAYIEHYFKKNNLKAESSDLSLHRNLLSLNWCDVITTNWDDLLDKSNEDIDLNLKYELVKRAKDLRLSNRRRLVKIHGSLRGPDSDSVGFDDCDDYLYVITEKDFREYSVKHEGFSSFMKVKFLEDSFCLFGFSGNDPNFKYWVGELKNIMQKGGVAENPNPIFLFYPNSEESNEILKNADCLFYKKNYIVPVNITDFYSFLLSEKQLKCKASDCGLESFDLKKCLNGIFDYFSNRRVVLHSREKDFITILDLNNLDINTDCSNSLLKAYIENTNLFSIANLTCQSIGVTGAVRNYFSDKHKYESLDYQFLYKYCMGNFYVLEQLFSNEVIDRLIKQYDKMFDENKIDDSYAIGFAELILGYYRSIDSDSDFYAHCEKYCKFDNPNSAIFYRVNKSLYEFDYKLSIEEIEKIEIKYNTEIIDILKYLYYKSILGYDLKNFFENKELINQLYLSVTTKKSENFTLVDLLFLLYCHDYFSVCEIDHNDVLNEIQSGFEKIGLHSVSDYYKKIMRISPIKRIEPNSISRHFRKAFVAGLQGNHFAIINFFEFLGCPIGFLLQDEESFLNLIRYNTEDEFFLVAVIFNSLTKLSKYDSNDFSYCIFTKVLRYMKNETMLKLYDFFYDCIDVNRDKKDINVVSYFELLFEIVQRIEDGVRLRRFFDFVGEEINKKEGVVARVLDSNYGFSQYAYRILVYYLERIETDEEYRIFLRFIIENSYRSNLSRDIYATLKDVGINKFKKVMFEEMRRYEGIISELSDNAVIFFFDDCSNGDKVSKSKIEKRLINLRSEGVFFKYPKNKDEIAEFVKYAKNRISSTVNLPSGLQMDMVIKELLEKNILDCDSSIDLYDALLIKVSSMLEGYDGVEMFRLTKDAMIEYYHSLSLINQKYHKSLDSVRVKRFNGIKNRFEGFDPVISKCKKWLYGDDDLFFESFIDYVNYCFKYMVIAVDWDVLRYGIDRVVYSDNMRWEYIIELVNLLYSESDIFRGHEQIIDSLIVLLRKFKDTSINIFDYDDVFMKKQMQLLANSMKKYGISDKYGTIDYWASGDSE